MKKLANGLNSNIKKIEVQKTHFSNSIGIKSVIKNEEERNDWVILHLFNDNGHWQLQERQQKSSPNRRSYL